MAQLSQYLADVGIQEPVLAADPSAEDASCWTIPNHERRIFELLHFRVGDPINEGPFPLEVIIDADGRFAYLSRTYEPQKLMDVLATLVPSTN